MKLIMEQIDVQETDRSNGNVNAEAHAGDGSPDLAKESTGTPHEQQGTTPEQSGEDAGARVASELEFHELAELFPCLGDEELEGLCADIKEHGGLVEPVTLYQGKVLDGRNRTRACEMAGIRVKTVEYTGDDPLAFVISRNARRRHLSESQRAMVAARLANMERGEHKTKSANLRISNGQNEEPATPIAQEESAAKITQDEAAKMMSVSPRLVSAAVKFRKEASDKPTLIEEVELGKKTINAALYELKSKGSSGSSGDAESQPNAPASSVVGPGTDAGVNDPGAQDAGDAQQTVNKSAKDKVASSEGATPTALDQALVDKLSKALAMPPGSPEQSDALLDVIVPIIKGCFTEDSARQEFLEALQAKCAEPAATP